MLKSTMQQESTLLGLQYPNDHLRAIRSSAARRRQAMASTNDGLGKLLQRPNDNQHDGLGCLPGPLTRHNSTIDHTTTNTTLRPSLLPLRGGLHLRRCPINAGGASSWPCRSSTSDPLWRVTFLACKSVKRFVFTCTGITNTCSVCLITKYVFAMSGVTAQWSAPVAGRKPESSKDSEASMIFEGIETRFCHELDTDVSFSELQGMLCRQFQSSFPRFCDPHHEPLEEPGEVYVPDRADEYSKQFDKTNVFLGIQ